MAWRKTQSDLTEVTLRRAREVDIGCGGDAASRVSTDDPRVLRLRLGLSEFRRRRLWRLLSRRRCCRSAGRIGLRPWDASLPGCRGPAVAGSPLENRACRWRRCLRVAWDRGEC